MPNNEVLLKNLDGISKHFYTHYANRPTDSGLEALGRELRIMHSNQALLAAALHELLQRP